MKRIILTACSATLLLIACNNSGETKDSKSDSTSTTTAVNTDVKKDEAWVPVDSAAAMKAMMEYGTPGEMHKMLASWNGTWSGETTVWESEGAAPMQSTGTAVNSMIFDGRYQTSTHKGNMMGMPFEGRSTMGYDSGTMPDITRPGKECSLREVFTVVDDNTQRMEMYGPDPKTGKEFKMMEIKMTRKK